MQINNKKCIDSSNFVFVFTPTYGGISNSRDARLNSQFFFNAFKCFKVGQRPKNGTERSPQDCPQRTVKLLFLTFIYETFSPYASL